MGGPVVERRAAFALLLFDAIDDLQPVFFAVASPRQVRIAHRLPDDIWEVLVTIAEKLPVVSALCGTVVVDLRDPSIARIASRGGGIQDHQDPLLICFLDHPVGVGEIGLIGGGEVPRSPKGPIAAGVVWGIVGILIHDEMDEDRVEPFLAPVFEVELRLLFRELQDQRPHRIPVH